jgi:hypothetical protein
MKRLGLIIAASLLAGCAGGQGVNSAGAVVCSRQDSVRAGLIAAMVKAETIADPVKREAALGALRVSLAALDKCPRL